MVIEKNYTELLKEYIALEVETLQKLDMDEVNTVINVLEKARKDHKHFFICGNGGSAATASHFAEDFNKGINMGLPSSESLYRFECLSDNVPMLTAVANDDSYKEIFRFPLSVKMREGDVVIGVSGSGNSENVVNALDYANTHGGTSIAIVGFNGGKMKEIAQYSIHVTIDNMQISEDVHMILDHMIMFVMAKR